MMNFAKGAKVTLQTRKGPVSAEILRRENSTYTVQTEDGTVETNVSSSRLRPNHAVVVEEEASFHPPTAQEQREVLENLARENPPQVGEFWNLVDRDWIMKFGTHTGFGWRGKEGKGPPPGRIDNYSLLVTSCRREFVSHVEQETSGVREGDPPILRVQLSKSFHFESLCPAVWAKLVQWYGGGPAISRQIIHVKEHGLVELSMHPMLVYVERFDGEMIVPDSRRILLYEKTLPANRTVGGLYRACCELMDVRYQVEPRHLAPQIWFKPDGGKRWTRIPNGKHDTLLYSVDWLKPRLQIVVETPIRTSSGDEELTGVHLLNAAGTRECKTVDNPPEVHAPPKVPLPEPRKPCAEQENWICEVCTLENDRWRSLCEACGTFKGSSKPSEGQLDQLREQDAPPVPPSQSYRDSNEMDVADDADDDADEAADSSPSHLLPSTLDDDYGDGTTFVDVPFLASEGEGVSPLMLPSTLDDDYGDGTTSVDVPFHASEGEGAPSREKKVRKAEDSEDSNPRCSKRAHVEEADSDDRSFLRDVEGTVSCSFGQLMTYWKEFDSHSRRVAKELHLMGFKKGSCIEGAQYYGDVQPALDWMLNNRPGETCTVSETTAHDVPPLDAVEEEEEAKAAPTCVPSILSSFDITDALNAFDSLQRRLSENFSIDGWAFYNGVEGAIKFLSAEADWQTQGREVLKGTISCALRPLLSSVPTMVSLQYSKLDTAFEQLARVSCTAAFQLTPKEISAESTSPIVEPLDEGLLPEGSDLTDPSIAAILSAEFYSFPEFPELPAYSAALSDEASLVWGLETLSLLLNPDNALYRGGQEGFYFREGLPILRKKVLALFNAEFQGFSKLFSRLLGGPALWDLSKTAKLLAIFSNSRDSLAPSFAGLVTAVVFRRLQLLPLTALALKGKEDEALWHSLFESLEALSERASDTSNSDIASPIQVLRNVLPSPSEEEVGMWWLNCCCSHLMSSVLQQRLFGVDQLGWIVRNRASDKAAVPKHWLSPKTFNSWLRERAIIPQLLDGHARAEIISRAKDLFLFAATHDEAAQVTFTAITRCWLDRDSDKASAVEGILMEMVKKLNPASPDCLRGFVEQIQSRLGEKEVLFKGLGWICSLSDVESTEALYPFLESLLWNKLVVDSLARSGEGCEVQIRQSNSVLNLMVKILGDVSMRPQREALLQRLMLLLRKLSVEAASDDLPESLANFSIDSQPAGAEEWLSVAASSEEHIFVSLKLLFMMIRSTDDSDRFTTMGEMATPHARMLGSLQEKFSFVQLLYGELRGYRRRRAADSFCVDLPEAYIRGIDLRMQLLTIMFQWANQNSRAFRDSSLKPAMLTFSTVADLWFRTFTSVGERSFFVGWLAGVVSATPPVFSFEMRGLLLSHVFVPWLTGKELPSVYYSSHPAWEQFKPETEGERMQRILDITPVGVGLIKTLILKRARSKYPYDVEFELGTDDPKCIACTRLAGSELLWEILLNGGDASSLAAKEALLLFFARASSTAYSGNTLKELFAALEALSDENQVATIRALQLLREILDEDLKGRGDVVCLWVRCRLTENILQKSHAESAAMGLTEVQDSSNAQDGVVPGGFNISVMVEGFGLDKTSCSFEITVTPSMSVEEVVESCISKTTPKPVFVHLSFQRKQLTSGVKTMNEVGIGPGDLLTGRPGTFVPQFFHSDPVSRISAPAVRPALVNVMARNEEWISLLLHLLDRSTASGSTVVFDSVWAILQNAPSCAARTDKLSSTMLRSQYGSGIPSLTAVLFGGEDSESEIPQEKQFLGAETVYLLQIVHGLVHSKDVEVAMFLSSSAGPLLLNLLKLVQKPLQDGALVSSLSRLALGTILRVLLTMLRDRIFADCAIESDFSRLLEVPHSSVVAELRRLLTACIQRMPDKDSTEDADAAASSQFGQFVLMLMEALGLLIPEGGVTEETPVWTKDELDVVARKLLLNDSLVLPDNAMTVLRKSVWSTTDAVCSTIEMLFHSLLSKDSSVASVKRIFPLLESLLDHGCSLCDTRWTPADKLVWHLSRNAVQQLSSVESFTEFSLLLMKANVDLLNRLLVRVSIADVGKEDICNLAHRSINIALDSSETALLFPFGFRNSCWALYKEILSLLDKERCSSDRDLLIVIVADAFNALIAEGKADPSVAALAEWKLDPRGDAAAVLSRMSSLDAGPHSPDGIDMAISTITTSGRVGLTNFGCTCYMNATLQLLFSWPDFRALLLSCPSEFGEVSTAPPEAPEFDDDDESATAVVPAVEDKAAQAQAVLCELKKVFFQLQESKSSCLEPRGFVEACKSLHLENDVYAQNDASEFLDRMVDSLETALEGFPQQKTLKSLFSGVHATIHLKEPCKHSSRKCQPFVRCVIHVQNLESLQQSLDVGLKGEVMNGENQVCCEHCNEELRDNWARNCFAELPDSLVFHLGRFQVSMTTFERFKVNSRFSFPLTLDMYKYMEGSLDEPADEGEHPEFLYELRGVLVHSGTAEGGHYFSLVRGAGADGGWLKFNDSSVTEFDINNLEEDCFGGTRMREVPRMYSWDKPTFHECEKDQNAFMLFYQRVVPQATQEEERDAESPQVDAATESSDMDSGSKEGEEWKLALLEEEKKLLLLKKLFDGSLLLHLPPVLKQIISSQFQCDPPPHNEVMALPTLSSSVNIDSLLWMFSNVVIRYAGQRGVMEEWGQLLLWLVQPLSDGTASDGFVAMQKATSIALLRDWTHAIVDSKGKSQTTWMCEVLKRNLGAATVDTLMKVLRGATSCLLQNSSLGEESETLVDVARGLLNLLLLSRGNKQQRNTVLSALLGLVRTQSASSDCESSVDHAVLLLKAEAIPYLFLDYLGGNFPRDIVPDGITLPSVWARDKSCPPMLWELLMRLMQTASSEQQRLTNDLHTAAPFCGAVEVLSCLAERAILDPEIHTALLTELDNRGSTAEDLDASVPYMARYFAAWSEYTPTYVRKTTTPPLIPLPSKALQSILLLFADKVTSDYMPKKVVKRLMEVMHGFLQSSNVPSNTLSIRERVDLLLTEIFRDLKRAIGRKDSFSGTMSTSLSYVYRSAATILLELKRIWKSVGSVKEWIAENKDKVLPAFKCVELHSDEMLLGGDPMMHTRTQEMQTMLEDYAKLLDVFLSTGIRVATFTTSTRGVV